MKINTSYLFFYLTAFFFFLFVGPLPANDINNPSLATPTCETYVEWTGQNIEDIDLSILKDRIYRVINPESIVTMDYLPDRLNIHTTLDGVILTQDCG